MSFLARALIVATALLAAGSPAQAGTTTATLGVRVVVQQSCIVSGATLDFGTYSSNQTKDLNGFTQIAFSNCPQGTLRFELDGGVNGSAGVRRLSDGKGSFLSYGLYRDSARTQVFGQGNDARVITLPASGSGKIGVMGRIPGRQLVPAGTYTDTVAILLTF
ncbi:spore coat U domain-containing protein [Benzoatithermus flavus]|uniref:Spore coat U domain-containing protein n=1 Tax=Benzoatithermus flavus TaxID=3108223 RepID=A0ABU8XX10_9PROT